MKVNKIRLSAWDMAHKNVLVRIDANVPVDDDKHTIVDDFKLQKALPTLHFIKQKGGTSILLTHRGDPHRGDPQKCDLLLSTDILVPWFIKQGFTALFTPTIDTLKKVLATAAQKPDLIILENLRFWNAEYTQDREFACALAPCGSFYVNDAFGSLHRNHTSITTLAECFHPNDRSIGFLVADELTHLSVLKDPVAPFLIISGGNKIKDKIEFLHNCIPSVNTIALCPALCFSYLAAHKIPVGQSLIDPTSFAACTALAHKAHDNNTHIITPIDFIVNVTENNRSHTTTIDHDGFDSSMTGLSLGPITTDLLINLIKASRTILFNGPFGVTTCPESLAPLHSTIRALAESSSYTIAAGGDTVSAIRNLGYENEFTFLSTGGGATLAFLGGTPLPGLTAIAHQSTLSC